MGFDKGSVRLRDGLTLLDHVLRVVEQLSDDLVVVANVARYAGYSGARVVGDVYCGAGSLGGIYSGLLAVRHQFALVVACDMPFLSLPLWQYMLALPRDYDVLMPRLGGQFEPLHAVYSRNCLAPIDRLLRSGCYKIVQFLPEVVVRYVEESESDALDPQRLSFFNANTPEDLAQAEARLERYRSGQETA